MASGKQQVKIGIHTSIAGSVENAAHHAKEIGCDTFQIFSANPRGWKTNEPKADQIERFRAARSEYQLAPLVIHDNYLINLATSEAPLREKSIAAFRGEIQRAVMLGADYLVTHPGSAGKSSTSDAIKTCAESLKKAADGLALDGLTVLIENTAGQGTALGRSFEEVSDIISAVGRALPVAACIDTAHCFEAGYAIHTEEGLAETVKHLDGTLGMGQVRVIHSNDSKTPFASHADRHEHIGKGFIGKQGLQRFVRHPKLRSIPFICETPIDQPGDDARDVQMMRRLAGVEKRERIRQ